MPDITGLPYLTDGVSTYLNNNGIATVVAMGWRDRFEQINEGDGTANRVIIQPGDPRGAAGELGEPRQAGQGPRTVWPPPPEGGSGAQPLSDYVGRELSDWAEEATIYIWAVDTVAPEDDRRQYIAVRTLLQWVRRALQNIGRAALQVGSLEWVNIGNVEKQYGRELALSVTYHAPLFDLADGIANPTTIVLDSEITT